MTYTSEHNNYRKSKQAFGYPRLLLDHEVAVSNALRL